ncbi:hypothetical protein CNR22_20125 [Sphingobacteriaceae bacterium]|nr:hypothetical protein CNR22_20125 [Sphingobacteriaceae bacterium]
MSVFPEKHFDKFYWLSCAIVFILVVLRCILVPFSHDEVATFNFYIQPGNFLPFLSHPDANGHFLTSATSWICFKLVGSSPQALRIPDIAAFAVLCFGVFKINKLFSGLFTKIIFSSAFILSYNFICFYSLCRGYGISMAFLTVALYYFFVYLRYGAFNHFWKFILFSQIALSANLTLVFVVMVTTAFVVIMQLKNKLLSDAKTLIILVTHAALTIFWIKYAFFLKESGALYYGSGESYWKVTFESLIETIFFKDNMVNIIMVGIFFIMLIYWVYKCAKEKMDFVLNSSFSISFLTFCTLIVLFYLLKKLVGVNYPEDRTGLFFYVFYCISFAFMISELKKYLQAFLLVIPFVYLAHFALHVNLRVHPWRVYETMPAEFFSILKSEQATADHRITIGGHRVREFFYAFLNYKSSIKLNHMTSPEALQMNTDYALAYKEDKPWYDPYYTELASEDDWGFRLLKRKTALQRHVLYATKNSADFTGNSEYYNAYEKLDTTFNSENPLVAEFNFDVKLAPEPLNAFLVLQIDTENGENSFLRIPMNLVRYDWNGANNFTLSITSGNIPLKIKRIVAYLWNIDKKQLHIKINSFRLYQLKGDGVKVISKAKI